MPLKAPPHGLAWRRLQDGAWELRKIKQAGLVEQEEEDKKEQGEHIKVSRVITPIQTNISVRRVSRYKQEDRCSIIA